MNQIRFKTGEFQEFTATRSFELSNFGVKVMKGREIEFDGSLVKYDGAQYQFPQFRSAVAAGWVVPTSEYDENNPVYQAPASANIKMRPTKDTDKSDGKTAATTIEADERIVMSSAKHAADTRQQNRPASAGTRLAGNAGVAEAQDGVPVRTLKTAAKVKGSIAEVTAAVHASTSVQIDPGQGITEQQMLDRMSETDRQVYLAQKSSLKSRYVDDAASSTGVKVGEVKSAGVRQADGVKLTQTVGGGTEVSDGVGVEVATLRKDETSERVEDGITFKNTNGPRRNATPQHPTQVAATPVMMRDGTADVRLQIARAMCPEFPQSYDFAAPERKKLARLQADFEDRPDVLRAVFAAESDDFKQKLLSEFPQAFRG